MAASSIYGVSSLSHGHGAAQLVMPLLALSSFTWQLMPRRRRLLSLPNKLENNHDDENGVHGFARRFYSEKCIRCLLAVASGLVEWIASDLGEKISLAKCVACPAASHEL